MSKIKFKVGHVVFNLPSRAVGDSTTCIGKVSINVSGLNCSNSLSFKQGDLIQFHKDAVRLYEALKGSTSIKSECTRFILTISATAKGYMKFEITMSYFQFASPENNEWQTNICFYMYPESLIQLVESKDEIYSYRDRTPHH